MFQPGAEAEEGLQSLLDSIVSQTTPDGRYAAYHAKQLQVLVRRKEKQPARSVPELVQNVSFPFVFEACGCRAFAQHDTLTYSLL